MPAYTHLLVQTDDRVQTITINRESKLNALNKETLDELHDAFTRVFNDVRVGGVIITGAGSKAFVAGADIREFSSYTMHEGIEMARNGQMKVFDLIAGGNKPVVAAINGYALGGGLELALACHFRIAAATAKMGLPEVGLGLIPGYGGTQRLTLLAGKGRAIEMILTGQPVTAAEALAWGIVNHVTEADTLLALSHELLQKIIRRSPNAVAAAIRSVNAAGSPEGFATEMEEFGKCFGTRDFTEGVQAFLEKREPDFRPGEDRLE